MRLMVNVMLFGASMAVLAGFAGAVHPALDTLAAFRLHLALGLVGLAGVGLVMRSRLRVWTGVIFGALGLLTLGDVWRQPTPLAAPDLVGYQHNLRYDNARLEDVIATIEALDPDFLLLQEVSEANMDALAPVFAKYPVQVICAGGPVGAVVVATRLSAFGAPGCAGESHLAYIEVQAADGLLTLASLHLPWPWPYEQHQTLGELAPALSGLRSRVILGTDANQTAWSATGRSLQSLTRTRNAPGMRPSFEGLPLWPGLAIDLTLVHADLLSEVRMLGPLGSDHRALEIRLRVSR